MYALYLSIWEVEARMGKSFSFKAKGWDVAHQKIIYSEYPPARVWDCIAQL